MRRWLVLSYLAVVVVVLVLLEIPLGILTAHHERDLLGVAASQQATSVAVLAGDDLARHDSADLVTLAHSYQAQTSGEVLVTDAVGQVLVDSNGDGKADLARLAPVVAAARAGRTVTESLHDERRPMTLAAVPIRNDEGTATVGAVVLSLPATASDNRIRAVWYALAGFGVVTLALTALFGDRVARSVTRPLAALEAAVGRFGAGHLGERTIPSGPPELRELAVEFNRMAAHIEDLLEAQSRFVADASHQLRSPLTALRLRLENLEAELGETPEAVSPLVAARTEVQRLSRLVDGLLTLSRADGAPPERRPVDVVDVIAGRVDAWEALADERGVALAASAPPLRNSDASLVPGDLEQILDNLLANALDATPGGRAISVDLAEGANELVIEVTDQGPGMTADERARAFDRFWQGSGRRGGSSGLGLAIVRQLSRRNGITVELQPASARGAAGGGPGRMPIRGADSAAVGRASAARGSGAGLPVPGSAVAESADPGSAGSGPEGSGRPAPGWAVPDAVGHVQAPDRGADPKRGLRAVIRIPC